MTKFYGAGRWDPKLILLQITCMQVRPSLCVYLSLPLYQEELISGVAWD